MYVIFLLTLLFPIIIIIWEPIVHTWSKNQIWGTGCHQMETRKQLYLAFIDQVKQVRFKANFKSSEGRWVNISSFLHHVHEKQRQIHWSWAYSATNICQATATFTTVVQQQLVASIRLLRLRILRVCTTCPESPPPAELNGVGGERTHHMATFSL